MRCNSIIEKVGDKVANIVLLTRQLHVNGQIAGHYGETGLMCMVGKGVRNTMSGLTFVVVGGKRCLHQGSWSLNKSVLTTNERVLKPRSFN
jgi:hypothetical protein